MTQVGGMLRRLIFAALIAMPVAVAAEPLQPTGKWTVDYAASQCVASRAFGTGETPLTLSIKPAHSGGSARLVLSNAWTQLRVANAYTASVDFADGGKPFRTDAMPAMAFGPSRAVVIVDLPAEQAARLRKSATVRIASGGVGDRTFAVGSLGQLFIALDKCVADLRNFWLIDAPPAAKAVPAHDLGKLFSWSNYPSTEWHHAKTDKVTARLLVDEKGNVPECLIMAGSGSTGLDVLTCQVFERRTSFRPALDQAGTPVRSAVDVTINWRR